MPRHVALLRAINVGGHTVRMDRLRALFGELGLDDVQTLIASGNAIFRAPQQDAATLETRIERHLHDALGYEVATFVRPGAALAAVADHDPFPGADPANARTVAFLKREPEPAARERVLALATELDRLAFAGRELHWMSGPRISDSPLSGAALERALGGPMTMRNVNTVRRLAERCAGS